MLKTNEDRKFRAVGARVPLVDGIEKVTGKAKYTADFLSADTLCGRIFRSPYSHADIISLDVSEAEKLPGVIAVITGEASAQPFGILPISQNEFALARGKVRFKGDPVAAIAAVDDETAEQIGRAHV